MLVLATQKPLALGHQRAIYQHPDAPRLLVKVMRPESVAKRWEAPGRWIKRLPRARQYVSYLREIKEFIATSTRADANAPLARVAGLVDTDRGLGLVYEKVLAADGALAPTLFACWKRCGGEPRWARAALATFRDALLRNDVIVGDLNAANVVYGRDSRGGPRLLMVDGFGEKSVIPLCSMSRRFNRHAIRRRYRRLLRDLATPVASWTTPRLDP